MSKPYRTIKEVNHLMVYDRIHFLTDQSNKSFDGWPKAIFLHHTHEGIDFDAQLIDIDERVTFELDGLPYGVVKSSDGRYIPFTGTVVTNKFFSQCGLQIFGFDQARTFLVKDASLYFLWIQTPSFFEVDHPTADGKAPTFRMSSTVDSILGYQISQEDIRMMGWSL